MTTTTTTTLTIRNTKDAQGRAVLALTGDVRARRIRLVNEGFAT